MAERVLPKCTDPLPDLDNASVGNGEWFTKPFHDERKATLRVVFLILDFLRGYFLSNIKGGYLMAVVNVGFQVLPKMADGRVYEAVDQAIAVVQKSGVKYEVGAMETVMEGELDLLMDIVKKAQEACLEFGASEVMTFIKVHYRPEGVSMDEKLAQYR